MSRKVKLRITDRTTKCCGIISLNGVDVDKIYHQLYDVLETYNKVNQFYYILHDNDDDTPFKHIHFILVFKGQQTYQRILNVVSDNLKIDINAVQVDKLSSLNSYLRYMCHIDKDSVKNNKHKYEITDIISNQVKELIESYINSNDDEISTDVLINLICDTNYDYEIMETLGIKLFHKYRYEIKTLCEERSLLREQRRIEREKELPF